MNDISIMVLYGIVATIDIISGSLTAFLVNKNFSSHKLKIGMIEKGKIFISLALLYIFKDSSPEIMLVYKSSVIIIIPELVSWFENIQKHIKKEEA